MDSKQNSFPCREQAQRGRLWKSSSCWDATISDETHKSTMESARNFQDAFLYISLNHHNYYLTTDDDETMAAYSSSPTTTSSPLYSCLATEALERALLLEESSQASSPFRRRNQEQLGSMDSDSSCKLQESFPSIEWSSSSLWYLDNIKVMDWEQEAGNKNDDDEDNCDPAQDSSLVYPPNLLQRFHTVSHIKYYEEIDTETRQHSQMRRCSAVQNSLSEIAGSAKAA